MSSFPGLIMVHLVVNILQLERLFCINMTKKYCIRCKQTEVSIRHCEYRILTFWILFWDWSIGRISYFDIRTDTEYRILTFEILFWHLNWDRISYFDIQNTILTIELRQSILFWHSKSSFDILTEAEYLIFCFVAFSFHYSLSVPECRSLRFKILFWHSLWGRILYFDIQNPILIFELRRNIVFWHLKSYFDSRTEAEYRILTFEILFWYSN